MDTQQTEIDYKRITRVRASGWLSFSDLCFHCGRQRTKMKEWTGRRDFPTPSDPDQNGEKLWNKERVDAWLDAHQLEAIGD